MRSFISLASAAAVLAVLTPGGAEAKGSMHQMMMGHAGPADKAFMQSMQTMMKAMQVRPTGNPDRDFARMMIPHHLGAVDMARIELRFGTDPMLRKMAAGIIKAQEREVGELKAWLGRHRL